MNRAGPSTDNMKRERGAISAVAMLDQHKSQGHSGMARGGALWRATCVSLGGCRVLVSVFFSVSQSLSLLV